MQFSNRDYDSVTKLMSSKNTIYSWPISPKSISKPSTMSIETLRWPYQPTFKSASNRHRRAPRLDQFLMQEPQQIPKFLSKSPSRNVQTRYGRSDTPRCFPSKLSSMKAFVNAATWNPIFGTNLWHFRSISPCPTQSRSTGLAWSVTVCYWPNPTWNRVKKLSICEWITLGGLNTMFDR